MTLYHHYHTIQQPKIHVVYSDTYVLMTNVDLMTNVELTKNVELMTNVDLMTICSISLNMYTVDVTFEALFLINHSCQNLCIMYIIVYSK